MKTKILVGSKNPIKILAVSQAFSSYFSDLDVQGIEVSSNVSSQPMGDETLIGAQNRAQALFDLNEKNNLAAHFFVGLESGIGKFGENWFSFGMICIIDEKKRISFGQTPHFQLPPAILKDVLKGEELGTVMDRFIGTHNIKQKEGSIGILTKGAMDRQKLYVSGLICALVPFVNPEWYFS